MLAVKQVELQNFSSVFSLERRVAVVTGGLHGLGLYTASGFVVLFLTAPYNTVRLTIPLVTILASTKPDSCKPAAQRCTSHPPRTLNAVGTGDRSRVTSGSSYWLLMTLRATTFVLEDSPCNLYLMDIRALRFRARPIEMPIVIVAFLWSICTIYRGTLARRPLAIRRLEITAILVVLGCLKHGS